VLDPILFAHEVAPLIFDIGGRLYPISIRDQMVRAQWLVDRAIEENLIGDAADEPRSLLVVGAGAAGVTAALRAASRGITTELVESSLLPFGRQLSCTSRLIDPAQYDWPAGHWSVNTCPPWPVPPLPLPWKTDFANTLALTWTRSFAATAAMLPRLRSRFATTVVIHPGVSPVTRAPPLPLIRVTLQHRSGTFVTRQFGSIVLAKGFGSERHTVPSTSGKGSYVGFRFWDSDPFATRPMLAKRALISGGGDGALQDFIRLSTGKQRAADALSALVPAVELQQIAARLHSHQEQALRAYAWGARASHDHAVHVALEQHQEAEVALLRAGAFWGPIQTQAARWFGESGLVSLDLVHPCGHFGQGYALNQFLVLLLVEALRGLVSRRKDSKVLAVDCLSHTPGTPLACASLQHEVSLSSASCGANGPRYGSPQTRDLVIIRHGVSAPSRPGAPNANPWSRHVLPFHLPM
jgi:hypothetical protein